MYYSTKHILSLVIFALSISFSANAQYAHVEDAAQTDQIFNQYIIVYETLPNKKIKTTKLEHAAARNFDFSAFISENLYKKEFRIRAVTQSGSGRTYTNFDSKKYAEKDGCTQFCEQIESIDKQTYLGVGVVAIDDFEGVMIETVIKNSAAEAAGLQPGDVITNIETDEIRSGCDLTMAIRDHGIGEDISIRYVRDEDPETTHATLGHRLKTMVTFVPCCDVAIINHEEVAEIKIADDSVVLFPNPSYGVSQMIFKSTDLEEVTMTISDVSGKEIIRKNYGEFDGYLSESIDLTEFSQGMYFMTIYQSDKVFNEKIILQRP